VGKALCIVYVLVARQPTVDRGPDQIGERELPVFLLRFDELSKKTATRRLLDDWPPGHTSV